MTKLLLYAGITLGMLCLGAAAVGQSNVALVTRTADLQALASKLQTRGERDRRQAQIIARQMGIPLRRELPNGKVLELQRFIPGMGPVFYLTYNVDAADSVSTDEVWPAGSAGLSLDGSGMTVGEWDGGAIALHPDFISRLTQVDTPPEVSDHSTHVAGTLVGSGQGNPAARGMAFDALLHAYDWNFDTAEMASAAASNLLLSNHSYGIAAGWINIGGVAPDNWWWIGGDADTDLEDANFGYYDLETQLWDQIAFDAPYYLIVKAAGNDRWDIGPDPGEPYRIVDQAGMSLDISTLPRPADCAAAGGYDCLPTGSVAKNILTVGAVHDVLGGYLPLGGPSSVQVTGFSGWGPTDDGRIKPDLVGNGWLLLSTYGQSPYYAPAIGTSMAAPNVTGSLLLLQQHYQNLHGNNNFMRAATLKALAIHTADETGAADGPDYEYGWGLLNTKRAAQLITDDMAGGGDQIIEATLLNGAIMSVPITVDTANARISITVVWTDPPGTPVPPALDPANLMLVNDLDLRVINGGITYLPWVLNPASPATAASKGDNFRDNVEQVIITGAAIGSYSIEVSHKGTLLSPGSQDYSLIISVGPPPPVSTGFIIDEDFSDGLPAGWSVDTVMGIDWMMKTPVPGDSRLDNLTGGNGKFAMVDVDYSYQTVTSLRTPALDLSLAESTVLSFNSFFGMDGFEAIYVEVSSNGGTSWSTVWQHQGFSPTPVHYVLDLTGAIAGQASATLRFRFDSIDGKQGNLWQIDDIQLETYGGAPPPPPPPESNPPGQAANPNPINTALDLAPSSQLSWSAGSGATSHDVYFGTTDTPAFQQNQLGTSFNPGAMAANTVYFWHIDEVNDDGTTPGYTWSFSTGAAPEVGTLHVGDLDASRIERPRKRWQATATVTIHDQGDGPLAGATITGVWSNGANGGGSCTTAASGQCDVIKDNLKAGVSSVSFTVTSVTHTDGQLYADGNNHDTDGDSNGSYIDIPHQPDSGNTTPTVSISGPANGATFNSSAPISFSGSANDAEDGNLSADLAWTSDIDGSLGSGGSFTRTLSDGSHTITAGVSDSDGATDADTVTVSVGTSPAVLAHVASLLGASESGRRGRWNASVTIAVNNAVDQIVSGVVVDGSWSDGTSGSGSCTTNGDGLCTIAKNNLKLTVTSVRFTVDNISGPGISYSPGGSTTNIVLTFP